MDHLSVYFSRKTKIGKTKNQTEKPKLTTVLQLSWNRNRKLEIEFNDGTMYIKIQLELLELTAKS